MDIKIFRSNKENMEQFSKELKYWSNGLGEIHNHGVSISEEDLPADLQRAYKDLWTDEFGSLCYLVETPQGFGVALLNEYDQYFADNCKITMDKAFQSVLKDSEVISKRTEFQNANIYIGEYSGFCECHELLVIFPATTPVDEFKAAATLLDELTYQAAKNNDFSLSEQIQSESTLVAEENQSDMQAPPVPEEPLNLPDDKILLATTLADSILSRKDGAELFFIASIYYTMTQCEPEPALTDDEILTLTTRINEAAGRSTQPLLTAERADAVRFMLELGISPNMSPEFTTLTAEQARKFLLSCDMEIFIDLVDAVAADSREYYAPESEFLNPALCERINKSIEEFCNADIQHEPAPDSKLTSSLKPSLADKIQSAAARAGTPGGANAPVLEPQER